MVGAESPERAAGPGPAGSGAAGAPASTGRACAGSCASSARSDPADPGAAVGVSAGATSAVADPDVQASGVRAVACAVAKSESHAYAGAQPVADAYTYAG